MFVIILPLIFFAYFAVSPILTLGILDHLISFLSADALWRVRHFFLNMFFA